MCDLYCSHQNIVMDTCQNQMVALCHDKLGRPKTSTNMCTSSKSNCFKIHFKDCMFGLFFILDLKIPRLLRYFRSRLQKENADLKLKLQIMHSLRKLQYLFLDK